MEFDDPRKDTGSDPMAGEGDYEEAEPAGSEREAEERVLEEEEEPGP